MLISRLPTIEPIDPWLEDKVLRAMDATARHFDASIIDMVVFAALLLYVEEYVVARAGGVCVTEPKTSSVCRMKEGKRGEGKE